jgi:N-hydroxyarylamine O-acetyltransferase
MSDSRPDLDAYFARIGYRGPRAPTLETLRAITELHPAAIPFENLSPFSGQEVPLDLDSLEAKLVRGHRGGYCFEHNLLLLEVLRAIGFEATGLSARVLWNQPPDAVPARGHMLLRLELEEGTYLADAGFGVLTLTAPLRLDLDQPQPTPHEPFRLTRGSGGDLRMQALVRGEWRTLYRFELSQVFPSDYAVTNYFLSTHPRSHFRTGLIAARATAGRRLTLADRRLTTYRPGAEPEIHTLADPGELRSVLEGAFDLRVPASPALDEALARLFSEGG